LLYIINMFAMNTNKRIKIDGINYLSTKLNSNSTINDDDDDDNTNNNEVNLFEDFAALPPPNDRHPPPIVRQNAYRS
jgi:hypothetical protein